MALSPVGAVGLGSKLAELGQPTPEPSPVTAAPAGSKRLKQLLDLEAISSDLLEQQFPDDAQKFRDLREMGVDPADFVLPSDIAPEFRGERDPVVARGRREARGELGREAVAATERITVGRGRELEDPRARFDIARSDEISEQLSKLEQNPRLTDFNFRAAQGPGGEPTLLFSPPDSEEFFEVDSDKVASLSDVAEVMGSVLNEATLTTTLTAFLTKGRSLLARTGAQVAAGGAGAVAQAGVEFARGFEQSDLQAIAERAATEGLGAGLGELISGPIIRAGRGITGRGFITPTEEFAEAQRFAHLEGLPQLRATQQQPTLAARERQVAATTKAGREAFQAQSVAANEWLEKNAKILADPESLSDEQLGATLQVLGDNILGRADIIPTTMEAGGRALQRGRKAFVKAGREGLNRRYADAASVAGARDITFNIEEAKKLAKAMKDGTPVRGADGEIRSFGAPSKELSGMLDRILALPDEVEFFITEGADVSAFEQIKAVRTEFFDLKNPDLGKTADNNNRIAGQLWGALTDSMNNPGGEAAEEAVRAIRKANAGNRLFESILDKSFIMQIASAGTHEDAGKFVGRLVAPGNSQTIRTLKRTLPKEEFARLQNSYKTLLISEPEKIEARFNAFRKDPGTLRLIMSTGDQSVFRSMGRDFKRLESSSMKSVLDKNIRVADRGLKIMETGTADELSTFVEAVGGIDSPLGRNLQAGVFTSLRRKSEKIIQGKRLLDGKIFSDNLNKLAREGKLHAIFSEEQIERMTQFRDWASFFGGVSDVGASIRAAEIASSLSPTEFFSSPLRTFKALSAVTGDFLFAKMLMSKSGGNFLLTGFRNPNISDATKTRAISAAMGAAIADLNRTKDKRVEGLPIVR